MQSAALEAVVDAYCHELTKALSTCRQLQTVLSLLQAAVATLLDGLKLENNAVQAHLERYDGLQEHWRQLDSLASEHGSWHMVKDCFYRRAFQELGEVLFAVVGPDWRPSFTAEQDAALFLCFFRQAPAPAVLGVLITHLSTVEVPDQPVLRGRATVTAVSAELACNLLEERFGQPSSPGLAQVLASITQQPDKDSSSGSSSSSTFKGTRGTNHDHSRRSDRQQQLGAADEALAASLASIPDRAAVCAAPLLQPAAFVPLLVSRMLQWLLRLPGGGLGPTASVAAGSAVPHSEQPCDGYAPDGLAKQLALAFSADLVTRLCKRGYANHVAAALWSSMQPAVLQQVQRAASSVIPAGLAPEAGSQVLDVAASVVASMADAAAQEKLVEAFLRLVAAAAYAHAPAQGGNAAHGQALSEAPNSNSGSSSRNSGSSGGSTKAARQHGLSSKRGTAEPAGPCEIPAQQVNAAESSPRQNVEPLAAEAISFAALRLLVPQGTWATRAEVRYLLTEKLLTRRVLPSSALRCLVQYLDIVGSPPSRPGPHSNASSAGPEDCADRTPWPPGNASSADPEDCVDGTVSGDRDAGGTVASAAATGLANPGIDTLADVACQLARVWGDGSSIQRLPLPRQAFLTAALQECLGRLGPKRFQAHPDLLSAVLQGVGSRLESPLPAVRRQGMRVGHSMSLLLDPAKPLFAEERPWELLPQEQWEQQQAQQGQDQGQHAPGREHAQQAQQVKGQEAARHNVHARSGETRSGGSVKPDAAVGASKPPSGGSTGGLELEEDWPLTETDSDDDGLVPDGGQDEELAPYDLEESDEDDVAKSDLQLRDLVSLLRNSEKDWKGQLRALRSAEALIRAAPDELELYGVPLARALLHTPIPKWAGEEARGGDEPADMQRFRSLVALVVGVPSRAGLALASEFYSPSLDIHHRDLLLTTLSTAAQELSRPGFFLQPLPAAGVGASGDGVAGSSPGSGVLGHATTAAAIANGGASSTGQAATAVAPARAGRVTRVSERSLAAARARAGPPAPSFVNKFPMMALPWAATLLRECDLEHHGIDLFGRDSFLLGRLLITLGTFVECCKNAPQAVPLSTAVLELVRARRVHAHQEPYVRRAALLAASQVMTSLPPARLSSAMLGAVSATDPEDAALVSRLDWLRQWTDSTAEHDTDEGCRAMATSCRRLQASLAAGALVALDAGEGGSWGGSAASGGARELLPAPKKGIQVALPQLEDLRLR